jgi:hypothetical protein
MKLIVFFFVVVAIIISLKSISHKPIVVEDMLQYQCDDTDPLLAVARHFKHPFYTQVIRKYAVTEIQEDNSLVISGYTWLGIELNRALYSCSEIKTLKSF